jgi:hypothetical protein
MSEKVTIELPDELSRRARKLAAAGNRRLEDAVVDWINRAVSEPDVEAFSDYELLRLCDTSFDAGEQANLSDLLTDAREGTLDDAGRGRLDDLMADYRRGLVLKARAWKEAVARGLRSPPSHAEVDADHAA